MITMCLLCSCTPQLFTNVGNNIIVGDEFFIIEQGVMCLECVVGSLIIANCFLHIICIVNTYINLTVVDNAVQQQS